MCAYPNNIPGFENIFSINSLIDTTKKSSSTGTGSKTKPAKYSQESKVPNSVVVPSPTKFQPMVGTASFAKLTAKIGGSEALNNILEGVVNRTKDKAGAIINNGMVQENRPIYNQADGSPTILSSNATSEVSQTTQSSTFRVESIQDILTLFHFAAGGMTDEIVRNTFGLQLHISEWLKYIPLSSEIQKNSSGLLEIKNLGISNDQFKQFFDEISSLGLSRRKQKIIFEKQLELLRLPIDLNSTGYSEYDKEFLERLYIEFFLLANEDSKFAEAIHPRIIPFIVYQILKRTLQEINLDQLVKDQTFKKALECIFSTLKGEAPEHDLRYASLSDISVYIPLKSPEMESFKLLRRTIEQTISPFPRDIKAEVCKKILLHFANCLESYKKTGPIPVQENTFKSPKKPKPKITKDADLLAQNTAPRKRGRPPGSKNKKPKAQKVNPQPTNLNAVNIVQVNQPTPSVAAAQNATGSATLETEAIEGLMNLLG